MSSSFSPARSCSKSNARAGRINARTTACESSSIQKEPDIKRNSSRRGITRRLEFRSEEHTSELQSQSNLVCRLLLEKKKKLVHFLTQLLLHVLTTRAHARVE